MVSFRPFPLLAASVATLPSSVFSAPPNDHLILKPRQNTITAGGGPAGITCYSQNVQAVHPALPDNSALTWVVTIPASSLPPGLPLAKKDQGTGSALQDALKHKCGLGITYEKYTDVGGGLAATFTTPITCRDGSVHDAIDDAFHTCGGKRPDAECADPPSSGSPDGASVAIAVLSGIVGGAGAASGGG